MSFFKNLGLLNRYAQSKPFIGLISIKWRADQILQNRDLEQLGIAAAKIQELIPEFKEERVKEETARYITRISERGGWELDYLPYGSRGTEYEIKELLENWPSEADDRPDLPTAESINDLDALQSILCSGYRYDKLEGFSTALEAEFYAVLALMKIDSAADYLRITEKRTDCGILIHPGICPWDTQDVIEAGNLIIEAMEIICYAERELSDEQLSKLRIEQRERMDAQIKADARKETSINALLAKNAENYKAQDFVKNEWAKHRHAYNDNKSAFSRTYVAIVANTFKTANGDPLRITEKQMREVWLKTPLSASKQAGELVDG